MRLNAPSPRHQAPESEVNFYNEIDPYAAQWLQNLIDAEEIPAGVVDSRDIRDIDPSELHGFTQVHLFAGIGGWPLALQRAGYGSTPGVLTGSCPCQPFSAAGSREGLEDPRHLWPVMLDIIEECRPTVVLGEQVASPAGLAWFDLVQADLEAQGYAVGGADLCAASVGAPHIRQRLYWVGLSADAGSQGHPGDDHNQAGHPTETDAFGHWSGADWVECEDPKGPRWRPIEPGTFPLASRLPGDVGKLRAYGNAIVPQVAEVFLKACMPPSSPC